MRYRLALATAIGAAMACSGDGPTGAGSLAGTFDLAMIDGNPLPLHERTAASGDELYTVGGELRVLSRGRLAVVRGTQWHSPIRGPLPPGSDTVVVTYRRSGAQLLLDYPITVFGGPYTDTATVQDDLVTVRTRSFAPPQVRSYLYHRR